eukprot:8381933-Lingulodinium_polyedra.AAC.1
MQAYCVPRAESGFVYPDSYGQKRCRVDPTGHGHSPRSSRAKPRMRRAITHQFVRRRVAANS